MNKKTIAGFIAVLAFLHLAPVIAYQGSDADLEVTRQLFALDTAAA